VAGRPAHPRAAPVLQPQGQHPRRRPGGLQLRQRRTRHLRHPLPAPARRRRGVFPVNIIANLYVSNGMSAGNTPAEARTQALSEIFERHIKFRIISEGLCLPDVPEAVIARYPGIAAGIAGLRAAGFGILVKDASLGGRIPGDERDPAAPARPGLLLQLRRPPALRDRPGTRADRTAAGPRPRRPGRLSPSPASTSTKSPARPTSKSTSSIPAASSAGTSSARSRTSNSTTGTSATTTAEDYAWRWTPSMPGHDIYIADFDHLGVYACRILVPGMSEIYPRRRPGMGEQQRRQQHPRSHPVPARPGRRRMRRPARHPQ
jgi:ribosomal protein S12 methylthiotransferase accessory factor